MLLMCQENSFLKEYTTTVKEITKVENGKFHVLFENTILFPEGGGQNTDHGVIVSGEQKYEIKNIFRSGIDAIHEIKNDSDSFDLNVGDQVVQIVDWERRFDHMQQHSGQHLISALFERDYNFNTKSWWLGDVVSYIELDASNITEKEIKDIETKCNEYIRQHLSVTVKVCDPNDSDKKESVSRASKGLPKDWTGPIRIINIDGVDANMCCGTHVSNLSQLQVIKLLNIEKKKNRTFLNFLVGDRVLKKLSETFNREQVFTQLLQGGPHDHENLLKKIKDSLQISQKTITRLSKDLATHDATRIGQLTDCNFYLLQRSEGLDPMYLKLLWKNLKLTESNKSMFIVVSLSDSIDSPSGVVAMKGDPKDIENLKNSICSILNGKGNGKNDYFQAKVTNLNKISEVEKLMENYFKTRNEQN